MEEKKLGVRIKLGELEFELSDVSGGRFSPFIGLCPGFNRSRAHLFTQLFEFAVEAIAACGEATPLLGQAQDFFDALGITAAAQGRAHLFGVLANKIKAQHMDSIAQVLFVRYWQDPRRGDMRSNHVLFPHAPCAVYAISILTPPSS